MKQLVARRDRRSLLLFFLPSSPTKGEVHPFLRVQRGSILIRQMGRGRDKIREIESVARSLIQSCRNEPSDSIIQAVIYILAEDETANVARSWPASARGMGKFRNRISRLSPLSASWRWIPSDEVTREGGGDSLTVIL